ncbi:MAG TPA: Crp/Fnr family transcriptional regulator [Terracidiphilus sp.]|nr:Crp/Fnr family transcriptional regulator [Terracidiphilus sp.]
MQTVHNPVAVSNTQPQVADGFLSKLPQEAQHDLLSLAHTSSLPSGISLFNEKDEASAVYFVLEGEVKLSMNSAEGKRLILRIARKGEVLGLASALSGRPREISAETLYPAKVASVRRSDFLQFLARYPEVYPMVTEELGRSYNLACDQLRTVGLSSSAPEKLARLLLEWSENGQATERGTRCRFPLTHGEIGEFIGASRETVTRTLSVFKSRRLVIFNGSTLMIPSRAALEILAHS